MQKTRHFSLVSDFFSDLPFLLWAQVLCHVLIEVAESENEVDEVNVLLLFALNCSGSLRVV